MDEPALLRELSLNFISRRGLSGPGSTATKSLVPDVAGFVFVSKVGVPSGLPRVLADDVLLGERSHAREKHSRKTLLKGNIVVPLCKTEAKKECVQEKKGKQRQSTRILEHMPRVTTNDSNI